MSERRHKALDWLSPLFPLLESLPGVRAILAIVLMFFLPGFAWTLVFFRQISLLERLVLSVGLSIAIVTLSILALNIVVGIRITGFNSLLIIITVTVIPLVFYYLRRFMRAH